MSAFSRTGVLRFRDSSSAGTEAGLTLLSAWGGVFLYVYSLQIFRSVCCQLIGGGLDAIPREDLGSSGWGLWPLKALWLCLAWGRGRGGL